VLLSIPSIPYLEAVLLLRRSASQPCSVAQAARALYVSERVANALLESLQAAGVAGRTGQDFIYAPRDETLAGAFDRLARAYEADLVGITNLIHDATQKSALRFAQAFRLRRDP